MWGYTRVCRFKIDNPGSVFGSTNGGVSSIADESVAHGSLLSSASDFLSLFTVFLAGPADLKVGELEQFLIDFLLDFCHLLPPVFLFRPLPSLPPDLDDSPASELNEDSSRTPIDSSDSDSEVEVIKSTASGTISLPGSHKRLVTYWRLRFFLLSGFPSLTSWSFTKSFEFLTIKN